MNITKSTLPDQSLSKILTKLRHTSRDPPHSEYLEIIIGQNKVATKATSSSSNSNSRCGSSSSYSGHNKERGANFFPNLTEMVTDPPLGDSAWEKSSPQKKIISAPTESASSSSTAPLRAPRQVLQLHSTSQKITNTAPVPPSELKRTCSGSPPWRRPR